MSCLSSRRNLVPVFVCFLLYTLLIPLSSSATDLHSLFTFQTRMASQGSTEAMIKLGEMCEEGLGTEKNEDQAREWYQKARDKGHPDAQSHLDKLKQKQARALQEQAAREKAAKEQAAREQAAREEAEREQAAREQAAAEQAAREQEARDKAAQEEAARREAVKAAMTPEEKAHAREEAIRRANEASKQSLAKQLEKEKAESDALKLERSTASKK